MKNIRCFVFVILFASFGMLLANDAEFNRRHWSLGTAHLLPEKRVEIGAFQPLRYGYSESLEFSTHPLLFFVMPNFSVKWAHTHYGGFTIASRHGVSYPTPLMRLISRKGSGGIISPEFDIPHILSFQNEILATRALFGDHLFTAKLGFNFAAKSGPLDPRTTIDLPIVYIRSSVYYNDYGFRFGADLKGPAVGRWQYLVDADLFYYPKGATGTNMAFEHKGMLLWNKSAGFQVSFGYLLSYGEYPYGTQWHLLPLFDLQWAWSRK